MPSPALAPEAQLVCAQDTHRPHNIVLVPQPWAARDSWEMQLPTDGIYQTLMLPCFPGRCYPEQLLHPQQHWYSPSLTFPSRGHKQPKPWLAFISLPSFRGTSKAGVGCTLSIGPVGYFSAWNHRGEQPSPFQLQQEPAQLKEQLPWHMPLLPDPSVKAE